MVAEKSGNRPTAESLLELGFLKAKHTVSLDSSFFVSFFVHLCSIFVSVPFVWFGYVSSFNKR